MGIITVGLPYGLWGVINLFTNSPKYRKDELGERVS